MASLGLYDYIIEINIRNVGYNVNNLFNQRRYRRIGGGVWSSDININVTNINRILFANNFVIYSNNTNVSNKFAYTTFNSTGRNLSGRIAEILAIKIFGNAKSRASFGNELNYVATSYVNRFLGNIYSAVANNSRNIYNIFNSYGRADFIAPPPVTTFRTMDLNNTIWDFPVNITTSLYSIGRGGNQALYLLNNGPNVGGKTMLNGTISIPIIIRFRER